MRNNIFLFNTLYLSKNSSVYSYLRYRQVLLFIYFIIIIIIAYIYTFTICSYILSGILGKEYGMSSYFNVIYNFSNFFINFCSLDYIWEVSFFNEVYIYYHVYTHKIIELFSENTPALSNYTLNYETALWFDRCGICCGRSTAPIGGSVNLFMHNRFGIFSNIKLYDMGHASSIPLLCNNNSICSNTLTLYSLDSRSFNIDEFYKRTVWHIQNYIYISGFYDTCISDFIFWKNTYIYSIVEKFHMWSNNIKSSHRGYWSVYLMSRMSHYYNTFRPVKLCGNINVDMGSYFINSTFDSDYLLFKSAYRSNDFLKTDFSMYTSVPELKIQYLNMYEVVNFSYCDCLKLSKSINNNYYNNWSTFSFGHKFLQLSENLNCLRVYKKSTHTFYTRLYDCPVESFWDYSYMHNNIYNKYNNIDYLVERLEKLFFTYESFCRGRAKTNNCYDLILTNNNPWFLRNFKRSVLKKWYNFCLGNSELYLSVFIKHNLTVVGTFGFMRYNSCLFNSVLHNFYVAEGLEFNSNIYSNFLKRPLTNIANIYNPWSGLFAGAYHANNGISHYLSRTCNFPSILLWEKSYNYILGDGINYNHSYSFINDVRLRIYSNSFMNINLLYLNENNIFNKVPSLISEVNSLYSDRCITSSSSIINLFNYELDVINYFLFGSILPTNKSNVNYYSIFKTNCITNYPITVIGYGYGIHNLWCFGSVGSGLSYYGIDKYNEYLLQPKTLFDNSLLNCAIYVLLKGVYIIYPVIFIILTLMLCAHAIYAYEFLLNDYVECVQFRMLLVKLLFYILYLYVYIGLFDLFLLDIFIPVFDFSLKMPPYGFFDSYGNHENIKNVDELSSYVLGIYFYMSSYIPILEYFDIVNSTGNSVYLLLVWCIINIFYILSIAYYIVDEKKTTLEK